MKKGNSDVSTLTSAAEQGRVDLPPEFRSLPSSFGELVSLPQATAPGPKHPLVFGLHLKKKVVVVVNIATKSEDGLANLLNLIKTLQKYGQRDDFAILLYPCGQLTDEEEVAETKTCSMYLDGLKACINAIGKTCFLMEKVHINGPKAHPVFKFLRLNSKLFNARTNQVAPIDCAFGKFLVKDGEVINFYRTLEFEPLENAVEQILQAWPDLSYFCKKERMLGRMLGLKRF